MMYGYARVSAPGQDPEGQVEELTAAGCAKLFIESASAAAGRKRPQLDKLLAGIERGDLVVVKRLNRIARSARDALNILAAINDRGALFRSLREPWADATTPMGQFFITVISGLAELDRELILERTAEGRAMARRRGVKLGRRPTLNVRQAAFVVAERAKVPPTAIDDLAALLKVSRSTIKRAIAKAEASDYPASEMRESRGGAVQIDMEDLLRARHPLSCAIHSSGRGNQVRCTCGKNLEA
jgi:DNA invertase Pin-like site-specific DNA recombinase